MMDISFRGGADFHMVGDMISHLGESAQWARIKPRWGVARLTGLRMEVQMSDQRRLDGQEAFLV